MTTRASEETAGLDLYSNININKKNKYWNLYISSRKFLRIYNR